MGQGTIIKRELGDRKVRYDVYYDLEPDPITGKRRQRKKVFQTKREAVAFLTAQRTAVATGTAVDRSRRTVRELMDFWLEHYARHRVSAKTFHGYASTIRRHIIPALGNVQIQKLTPARLQEFCTQKINEGCGPRTVELCHLHISQALDEAVQLGWVARNVADVVKPPRWKPREMATWSTDEAQRFMDAARASVYGPIWLLALATGMRKGELLGLRWCDVDFDRGIVSIRQTVGTLPGTIEFKPPKTTTSRREIHIMKDMIDALRQHHADQLKRQCELHTKGIAWKDDGLVFASALGGPIHPDNADRDFDRLVRRAGVKPIRIHDLRYTFATLAIRAGIPIKVVSESLGHADIATSLRTYAHVLPVQRTELAEKIGALLFKGSSEAT